MSRRVQPVNRISVLLFNQVCLCVLIFIEIFYVYT